jgi:hypothetical protein
MNSFVASIILTAFSQYLEKFIFSREFRMFFTLQGFLLCKSAKSNFAKFNLISVSSCSVTFGEQIG